MTLANVCTGLMSHGTPPRPATWRWLVGGAVSGAIGAILFGVVLAVTAPEVLESGIPGFYGLTPSVTVGWIAHVLHGTVLGVLFAVLVTRSVIYGMLATPAETDVLAGIGGVGRLTLAGVVYGIALWAILPFVGVSLLGAVGLFQDPGFGGVAAEMFIGHVLFGGLVGALFAVFIPGAVTPSQRDPRPDATGE